MLTGYGDLGNLFMGIKACVSRLLNLPLVVLISKVNPAPSDVDFYVHPTSFSKAVGICLECGFVRSSRSSSVHCVMRKFESGNLYIFDLVSDFNIYTSHLPIFKLTAIGSTNIGKSADLCKRFKYLCYKKLEKIAYDRQEQIELLHFLRDPRNYICEQLARNSLNLETVGMVEQLMGKYSLLGTIVQRLKSYRRLLRTPGKSIAFIGPDGSGKSFIIDRLQAIGPIKTVYMGDYFFIFQKFYNLVMKIPTPYNRWIYGFYVVENLLRAAKVRFFKFLGYIVLIDRFPGTNRNSDKLGSLGKLNRITFGLVPKPDVFVLLIARPEVVYGRKQELSLDQIASLQAALTEMIRNYRHTILDTEQLDVSLNTILKIAYDGYAA